MKTSPSLYQEMTDYLETMIAGGVFRPGERLMPLRELGNRFGVSPSTVRRGIEYLCEKGLLEMRHGSGTYVVEKRSVPENGERSVAVFIISDDLRDSYCAHALRGVQLEAARRKWPLRLFFSTYEEAGTPDFIERHRSAWQCNAVIMLGCYDGLLRQVPRCCPGGAGEGIGADACHETADADQPPGASRTALEVVADVGVEGAEHQPDRDQHREVDADHHVFQSVHHRVLSAVFSVPFRKIRRAGVPGCSIRRTASSITSAPASCQSSAMVSTGS